MAVNAIPASQIAKYAWMHILVLKLCQDIIMVQVEKIRNKKMKMKNKNKRLKKKTFENFFVSITKN